MINVSNSVILILTAAIITFGLRLAPFAIFSSGRKMPSFLTRVSAFLPTAIMSVLVVYCLKNDIFLIFGIPTTFIPAISATIAVILIHLWKRNTLLSVAVGTIIFMILIRII